MDGEALDAIQVDAEPDLYDMGFDIEHFRRAFRRFWARRGMGEPKDDFNRMAPKDGGGE